MMTVSAQAKFPQSKAMNDSSLDEELQRTLFLLEKSSNTEVQTKSYVNTIKDGLLALLRRVPETYSRDWEDAVSYCRHVIISPLDDTSRAMEPWARSCSELTLKLMDSYGPSTIEAGRRGSAAIIKDHFNSDSRSVAHVDKKQNFLRNWKNHEVGEAFRPSPDILTTGCYECGTLPCALVLQAWGTPEKSIKLAAISHPPICDDYNIFTLSNTEARINMCALALGAAYEYGGWAVNAIIDGTMLKALGNGTDESINSVMAWRCVGGAAQPYSSYMFGKGNTEDGLVAPQIMVAIHDIYDWRCDVAANNHENGVSGLYGLGYRDPFHTYLEALLEKAVTYPVAGLHAIAAMTITHFVAARYGAYEYQAKPGPQCEQCVALLQQATNKSPFEWEPKPPPKSFREGCDIRRAIKVFADDHEDCGLAQKGLNWFQHLIFTGSIWVFDLLRPGVQAVDIEADWS